MTGRQTRSVETENAIRQCAEFGLTQTETAAKLGLSDSTVSKHARVHAIEFRSCSSKTAESVRACADRGLTRKETAAELGLSTGTVWQASRRHNIPFAKKRKHDEAIAALANEGKTRKQISELLGVASTTISQRVRALGLDVDRQKIEGSSEFVDRSEAMASMYRAGRTLEQIGQLYGISRERVRQVIKRDHGLTSANGGQTIAAARTAAAKATARELKYMEKLGCGWDEYVLIRAVGKDLVGSGVSRQRTPMGAYVVQRSNARKRDLDWTISFWDWWTVWQDSGRWAERGRGVGYMMCRIADTGGYEVGNVYIATGVHNGKFQPNNPYRKGHPDHAVVMLDLARKRAARSQQAEARAA